MFLPIRLELLLVQAARYNVLDRAASLVKCVAVSFIGGIKCFWMLYWFGDFLK